MKMVSLRVAALWCMLLPGVAFGMLGCSPMIRLAVRLLPPQAQPLKQERLHVFGAKACPPGPLTLPKPGVSASTMAERFSVKEADGGFEIMVAFRGSLCTVAAAVWYDANGNRALDRDDYVANIGPVEGADRGIFLGNLTQLGATTMTSPSTAQLDEP